CIWHRPAARSALPPRRPPWQVPPFAPCVALRLLHKQLGEKELPPPSRPSTYKALRRHVGERSCRQSQPACKPCDLGACSDICRRNKLQVFFYCGCHSRFLF